MTKVLIALVIAFFTLSAQATDVVASSKWTPRFDQSPHEYIRHPQLPSDTPRMSIIAMRFIFNRLNLGIYNGIGLSQETLPVAITLVEESDKIGTALTVIGTVLGNPAIISVGATALAVSGKKEPVLKVLRWMKSKT